MATAGERYFYGTGRRKTAVARVRLYPGTGEIVINGKGYLSVFTRGSHQAAVLAPLKAAAADQRFNVQAKVAGGGITGCGVARDAAMRGMRVALFERGDYGSGTSSASSKLFHGGIRYLEQLEFHLVWEALRERAMMSKLVPHLAQPVVDRIRRAHVDHVNAQAAGLNIITWSLERAGVIASGHGGWYYQSVSKAMNREGDTLQPAS